MFNLVKLKEVQCKADIMNKCHLLKRVWNLYNNDYTTLQRQNMKNIERNLSPIQYPREEFVDDEFKC